MTAQVQPIDFHPRMSYEKHEHLIREQLYLHFVCVVGLIS